MSNSNPVLAIAVIGVLALVATSAHAGQPANSVQTRQSVQRTPVQRTTPAQQVALKPLPLQTRQSPVVRPTSTPSHAVLKHGAVADQTGTAEASATGDRAFRSRTGHVMASHRRGEWIEILTIPVRAAAPAETLDIAHEGFLDDEPSAAEDTGPEESIGFVFQQVKLKQDANAAANATDDLKSTKSALAANGQKRKEAGNDIAIESMTLVHEGMEKPAKEIDPASVAWVSGEGGTRN